MIAAPAIATALWLGMMTAISPCTVATNIAAISLIGSTAGGKRHTLLTGFLYALGRSAAYVALGMLIAAGLTASDVIARFLQTYMNEALGPLLIILGLVLLGWFDAGFSLSLASDRLQKKAAARGFIWAFPIGFLFALSFCPISAALFFVGLIPLAIKQGSTLALPACFGLGTALPVIIFAAVLAFASQHVSAAFERFRRIEKWIRVTTAIIFILVGIRYTLCHIYGLAL